MQAIKRVSDELALVLKEPETVLKIQATGFEPMIGGPDQLAMLLKKEMEQARSVVMAAGLQPE
jgi:tripartite-type tricarboxylate transporter receptor subunit TctC